MGGELDRDVGAEVAAPRVEAPIRIPGLRVRGQALAAVEPAVKMLIVIGVQKMDGVGGVEPMIRVVPASVRDGLTAV